MSNLIRQKNITDKKDQMKVQYDERILPYQTDQLPIGQDQIIITVIPCGREDGRNTEDEKPYELKIRKKVNENSLKEIFLRKPNLWEKVFKQHLCSEAQPNFSVYRKPFDYDQDPNKSELFLHILYMKSSEKALTRNYNAQELELFCHNRFYGPLVVAYNLNKPPYYLVNFTLQELLSIEQINRNFQNKSIKDDYVPECLTTFDPLLNNLDMLYKNIEVFTFYMFKYKTSWCPNKKDSHDSKSCIYAHHTRDFRRPPEIFKYLPEDCETLIKGIGWDKCDKGLKCNKCHTTVERLYHPDKYKRIFCDRSRCNKSEICAFYHSQKERNQANKECKNFRKSVQAKNIPDINHLHDQLMEHYKAQHLTQQHTSEELKERISSGKNSSDGKSPRNDEPNQINNQMNQLSVSTEMKNNKSQKSLDSNSPMFQPTHKKVKVVAPPMQQMNQMQASPYCYYSTPDRNYIEIPQQQIQMPNINLFGPQQEENQKLASYNFEQAQDDFGEGKTRNSTFSKASEGREEINRNINKYYPAFQQDVNGLLNMPTFLPPVEDEEPPAFNKQPSGKSPCQPYLSPVVLDFLDDDQFFQGKKQKSKTEFMKRDRQESEDIEQEEVNLPEWANLNSIFSNNSIQFSQPRQSRFSFFDKKQEQRPGN